MYRLGVILLSGGLDSTTVAAYARAQGYELTAITLRYGQKHSREVEAARQVASLMGIKQEVIDVSFFARLAWYSALTGSLAVPRPGNDKKIGTSIPATYVPLRNTFFITLAGARLESAALELIENKGMAPAEVEAHLFIASNAIDYSGYPDCRPAYYERMSQALYYGSKLGVRYRKQIIIDTPVISMTKAEIIRMAISLHAPLEYTWSCYEGEEVPCGRCDSCILRARGFAAAGYQDPLILRLEKDGRNPESQQEAKR